MVEFFDRWVHLLGPLGYPVLGLAALIEYLAPPFPGDTITLLGGAYAARGERSLVLVLASLMLGSLLGVVATWSFGRALAGRIDRLPEGRILPGITHAHIRRAQELMRERGTFLLIANRFLPTFRTVVFIAAGASRVPLRRVVTLGGFSALLWNSLLLAVGAVIGDNVEQLEDLFRSYRLVAAGVVVAVLVILVARFLWRRHRAQLVP